MVPAAAPVQTAADSAAVEPTNRPDPQPVWQWFVRKGDTVDKACRVIYGWCDEQTLRAVFAYNPKIGSNGMIRPGDVIIMPERLAPLRSN
jgi:phage tail protein X